MSGLPRSQHVDRFNHDQQAHNYDADVADETNPVRAGYSAALTWVTERCNNPSAAKLLELGCGTGNLTCKLRAGEIVAVDISAEMLTLAAAKIAPQQRVRFAQADAMEFTGTLVPGSFDVVASTYALHHLTDTEKQLLLIRLADVLRPGGRLVIADLMFADAAQRMRITEEFARAGHRGLVADIHDEFFWDAAATTRWLADLGFAADWAQISTLTWCLRATR